MSTLEPIDNDGLHWFAIGRAKAALFLPYFMMAVPMNEGVVQVLSTSLLVREG